MLGYGFRYSNDLLEKISSGDIYGFKREVQFMAGTTFKILAIDGGGIRGVYPAHILKRIAEAFEINIYEHFDLIAGTSTGAIVASSIACQISPSDIVEFYKTKGEGLFSNKRYWKWKFVLTLKQLESGIKSLHSNDGLYNALGEVFKDTKLGDISKPLLLPATDIGNGNVLIFKSQFSPAFVRDKNIKVKDAVMASCAAPTFFDPHKVDTYLSCDGGLWANNPALAAVIEAQHRLKIDQSRIKVFSIGTGFPKTAYGVAKRKFWGLVSGWRGAEFVSFMMALQAQATQNYLKLLLNQEQILRINFETDLELTLDDVSQIDELVSRADSDFTYASAAIKEFLEIK